MFFDSKDNCIVFTRKNGVYFVSKADGKINKVYPANSEGVFNINQVIKGKNGEYWIASTNGIVNINVEQRVSFTEFDGQINCLLANQNCLFIGTGTGLIKMRNNTLIKINGINEKITSIIKADNKYFTTSQSGVFAINNEQSEEIINWSANFQDVLYLKLPINKLITSLDLGLFFISEQNGILTKERPLITT